MAGSSTAPQIKKINDNGNGLLLYQCYPSYYCQKVVFALQEKKLKYKSRIIDLYRGEQLEPWFLKINPKGEVPVLQDGVKIIPDSRRIIDYIEDNFSNGNTPRLIPEKGSVSYQTMERMRDLLDNIPIGLITYGCLFNTSLTGIIKMSAPEIRTRQGAYNMIENLINDYSEKNTDFKDLYSAKKTNLEKNRANAMNVSEVENGLLDVEYALKEVEKVLASHEGEQKKWWLCCEKFTIADISLSVFIKRLNDLGLTDRFFKDNELPNLQEYFTRVQLRESYKKTMNQSTNIINTFRAMETKDQMLVTVGSVAMVLCAAGVAAFLIQRHK
ncbi:ganglioside-induced differentiation-associated protein 1 [Parasteatoda tepidariorum]|uniref:ganglioside-induced differentiation-associated protein 1 n=1 Tax=Parasteatoda tepidariorum TaxID=114398 RepID=UPI00077FDEB7